MRNLTRRALRRDWPSRAVTCPQCFRQQQQQQQQHQQQRRQFASSTLPPKPAVAGIAALPSRQLLSVSGPEAAKFLQGIVTANVTTSQGLPRTDAFYSGLLNATGRVVHDIFIYPIQGGASLPSIQQDGFLIEADASQMARFAKQMARYRLRAKVTLRAVPPDEASVWQAWDEESPSSSLPHLSSNESRMVLQDPRAPGLGYRVISFGGKTPEVDLDATAEDAYTIRRYLRGVPEGQDEILREQALPLESNMELMNGIDFRKGCYIGQELTIRTKHRGVVRKRILPCVVYGNDRPAPLSLTYDPSRCEGPQSPERLTADMIPAETSIGRSGKKGRSAGKWLKGLGNIGLALCRLEIMTDLVLPGEQAAASYNPQDEFALEWGESENRTDVKVKAFVPEWLRERLSV